MSLNVGLLLFVFVAFGVLSIYVGVINLKHPDAAWARVVANLERRGKTGRRTARWDRSRVFNGGLSIFIGVLLLGFAGWAGVEKTQGNATQSISYSDPVTGKYVTRSLSPEEARQLKRDPQGFMEKIAPTGGK